MKKLFTLIALSLCCYAAQAQINGGKKLLIVATNSTYNFYEPQMNDGGCFAPEIADFYGIVHKYGFEWNDIDIVSPNGGNVTLISDYEPLYQTKVSTADLTIMRNRVKNTMKPSEVNPDNYNIVYFAGGASCLQDFPKATAVGDIAAKIYEKGGKIGAVCDGISGLIPIKLSNGKYLVDGVKVITNDYSSSKTTYKIDVAEELMKHGGIITNKSPYYFADKNIVTGQDVRPVEVATELMKLLGTNIWATNVAGMNAENNMLCYPNPANNLMHLNLPMKNTKAIYTIYNVMGQTVWANKELINETIDLTQLPAGKYILNVVADEKHYTANITKE